MKVYEAQRAQEETNITVPTCTRRSNTYTQDSAATVCITLSDTVAPHDCAHDSKRAASGIKRGISKTTCYFLALLLTLVVLPLSIFGMQQVSAASTPLASGGATIDLADASPPAAGTGWTYDSTTGVYTVTSGANVTVTGNNGGTNRRLSVLSGSTNVRITLENATINVSAQTGANALNVTGANVTVVLSGTNALTSGANRPGILVPTGSTLTITSISGDNSENGTLTATGGALGAGIGGGGASENRHAGTIKIDGGTVTATGIGRAAGIGGGGGSASGNGGNAGTITINGGTITATSSSNGAGIGSGADSSSAVGSIIINGGTINAQGGAQATWSGAGIGSGSAGRESVTVSITGGTITATGGPNAPGIGSGYMMQAGTTAITIMGGTITAAGGSNAPGIGRGISAVSVGSLALDGNAIVFANSVDASIAKTLTRGILFDGTAGTVYGSVTPLQTLLFLQTTR
jgi:hypothetical protein